MSAQPDNLWWLETLYEELSARQLRMRELDDYYRGDHPLPFLTESHGAKMANEFANLLSDSRSNFMRLVVDAVEERLKVEGFRLSAQDDPVADRESWRIWQQNEMDSESQSAFIESLVKGVSYVSVWADADGSATLAVEDPLQTIVGYEPGSNFKRRAAALKVWTDEWTGLERANLYRTDGIYKFEGEPPSANTKGPTVGNTADETTFGGVTPGGSVRVDFSAARSRWRPLERPDEDDFLPNPRGREVVPIVPLRNRPRPLTEGESELSDVCRVQNQINGFLFLLALAGYFGAHRQRWAVGLTIMQDKSGKPIEPFRTAVDTLWATTDKDTEFGEFDATNLDGYIKAIEQKVLHIAVTTRTPRHYLIEQGQSPSGDAIKSAESGLTKKVERKQRPFGEALEKAIRIARLFEGEEDSPPDSEIVWSAAEIRTEAEITDAAVKKYQTKLITWEQACEDMGYTQTQIARMKQQRAENPEAFAADPASPDVPSTSPEVATV